MKRSVTIFIVAFFVVALAFGREMVAGMLTNEPIVIKNGEEFSRQCPAIDTAINVIVDPNQTLKPIVDRLADIRRGKDDVVTILHIGDSHIQGDFFSGMVRDEFRDDFGSAGRGVIVPTGLAGTNGGADYKITSPNRWQGIRCVERDNVDVMGVGGLGITTASQDIELTIESDEPFSVVNVLHHERAPRLIEPDTLSVGISCPSDDTDQTTKIVLKEPVTSVTLRGRAEGEYDRNIFYGFMLENGKNGVLYNSLGVNGAGYAHYTNERIISGLSKIHPDLIIVSLGTNDCFGANFRIEDVMSNVANVITKIKAYNENVPIIITTPMECYMYRRVRGRRSLVMNPNVAQVASSIVDYAAKNGVACWDFYSVAGGRGANSKWLKCDLARRDRIHLTVEGYQLQGQLFYNAFLNYYNRNL